MRLTTKHLILAGSATLALALVVTLPGSLRGKVGEAVDGLGEADPRWLWAAVGALAVMHVCSGLAWGSGLRACGSHLRHGDATARYCVGSGVGAVAPFHLGSAIRLALFGRAVNGDGAMWRLGGVVALVGAVRTVWFSGLVVAAVVVGPLPAWPLAVLAGGAAIAVAVAHRFRRVDLGSRLEHLLLAFREVTRAPLRFAGVAILTLLGLVAKVGAAAATAAALGIDQPLLAAVLIVPAVELSSVMPVTPGNAGVASAAIAFALASIGVAAAPALAVGIAFGAVEILCGLCVGAAGAFVLTAPRLRPVARLSAAGATSGVLVAAVGLTLVPAI